MKKTISFAVFALLLAIVIYSTSAQRKRASQPLTLGWDLTYSSLLKSGEINTDDWIWRLLGSDYKPPIERLLADWDDEPITSSILIEMPASHGGERVAAWLVRTENRSYCWEFLDGKANGRIKGPFATELYDKAAERVSTWQQAEPLKPEETPEGEPVGYCGALSFYGGGQSRQILLTLKDFVLFDNKKINEGKAGRLMDVFKPILFKQ
jgi:hypothetical protein